MALTIIRPPTLCMQFAQLPVPFEVVPALTPEVGLQLVQQATQMGGEAGLLQVCT